MTIFAVITPLNPSTGLRETIRMSSSGRRGEIVYSGQKYWPAINRAPTTSLRVFDGDFSSSVQTGSASFNVSINALTDEYPGIENHRWAGSDVTLTHVDDLGVAQQIFVGKITRFGEKNGILAITAEVDEEPFKADVLSAVYAGTTGIEGGADNKGNPKPLVLGRAKNVPPVQINVVDNVFQVSSYGPIQAISAVYERGAAFGASMGNYADYAALVAAVIPEGRWATCLASGLFRLGAPPYGVITADVDGLVRSSVWLRRTGAIIKALAEMAGASAPQIDSASLDALDVAVPYNVNIVISGQIDVLSVAQRMALACNAQAGIDLLGRIFVTRVNIGSPVMVLNGAGKNLPGVIDIAESSVRPPYKRIVMGADRSWRVHSFDEIAFEATLIEKGTYSASAVYREGNIVDLVDKSRWVFVGETPASNSYPAADSFDWELLTSETDIHNIGGNQITHASDSNPNFPEFSVNGTGDRHVDLEGRRYVQNSVAEGHLTFGVEILTLGGEPLVQGWRRIDPVARIGGKYGLMVQDSTGENKVDSDLLNNFRRTVAGGGEVSIDADASGNILTQFPLEIPITAYIGNTNVSADANFVASFPAGISGSVNNTAGSVNRGNISVTAFEAAGSIQLTVTFPDGLIDRKEIKISLRSGSISTSGGAGATIVEDKSWDNAASETYTQITDDPLELDSDASGNLKFRFYSTYTGSDGDNITAVARYRLADMSDSWADAEPEKTGNAVVVIPPSNDPFEPEPGFTADGYINQAEVTKAVGANSTTFKVALFAKLVPGSGTVVFNSSNNIFSVKQ